MVALSIGSVIRLNKLKVSLKAVCTDVDVSFMGL